MNVPFLSLQDITSKYQTEIHEAVLRAVDSGWYLQGNENQTFERQYAEYIGTQHCVGCANGLDALILILRAYMEMGALQSGDEVIVPANTYIATILAITENNLVPVLVEPDEATLQIDDTLIEQHITERTRAIMIVHLYGRLAYTERIGQICKQYGLKLMEDNAQAHGCRYRSTRTGALGDAAAHSFYPGKNLGALGDGGAVTTDDEELAKTVRTLANYGSSRKYVFPYQGRNSRLDELQAAVLAVKLKHLDEDNARRQQVAQMYYDGISNADIVMPRRLADENNVYHLFPVLTERRDELQKYLADKGIQTLIHYPIPPHKQQCYSEWNALSLPVTERIAQNELSLPISQCLTDEQAEYVVAAINSF